MNWKNKKEFYYNQETKLYSYELGSGHSASRGNNQLNTNIGV